MSWLGRFAGFRTGAVLFLGVFLQVDAVLAGDPVPVSDPMLVGDPIDPETGLAVVVAPGAPWLRRGPDGVLGTQDDVVDWSVTGDVDLVVRVGAHPAPGPIPAPAGGALVAGVAEPFQEGTPIPVSVWAMDGADLATPVVPDYFEGLPILVMAYPDLDGDGLVGVTALDGDATDAALEARELDPVAMAYVIGAGGVATGLLWPTVGGPADAPLRVAITAATYAGPFRKKYFESMIPEGPAVFTRLPFAPQTEPVVTIQQGLFGLLPAAPEGRLAVQPQRVRTPDPADPRTGESYTLHLDGRHPSIDVAEVVSGAFARPAPMLEAVDAGRVYGVRPAADLALAGPPWLTLGDDGAEGTLAVRVVATDRLGNVTMPASPAPVSLRAHGPVLIVSPDTDSDPTREELVLTDGRGVDVVLDDRAGAGNDANHGWLSLKAVGRPTRVEVFLADADIDEDGLVTTADLEPVVACAGFAFGDDQYNPHLDLNGDGRVDEADADWVSARLGSLAAPDHKHQGKKKKVRKWKPGKPKKPKEARHLKRLREEHGHSKGPKLSKLQKIYCSGRGK